MSTLTIIMPARNALPFIEEAVGSILRQTFTDFTLLIMDDGSTDGTTDYLKRLTDQRVRVVHGAHRGLGAVLNHGIELCRSEYLARMDADDVSLPQRLQQQIAFLRSHPEIGIVGTQFSYVGTGGARVPSPRLPRDHSAIAASLTSGRLGLVHATLMFRRAILHRLGGYRIAGIGEDWDLFLRAAEATLIANLDDVHYLWRLHGGNSRPEVLLRHQLGIEYACRCARLREQSRPEPTFDEFLRTTEARGGLRQLERRIDAYALGQYRQGLCALGEERRVLGSARLAWAALCAPRRTWARLSRS